MAKLGVDYCDSDELTPSSEDGGAGASDFSTSSFVDEEDDSSSSYDDSNRQEKFPIMKLPVEIRAKILNMIHQRQVPSLRLVSQQWREEIDQFYEFAFNIYDTTSNLTLIKHLRCRECIIWKLTRDLGSDYLFMHPSYLRVIKVFGPTSAENLRNLIAASTNLKHLTMTRRANYPWVLNLQDTPELSNLTELKYLRLMSEEHVQIHRPSSSSSDQKSTLKVPPMMDCYFPKLKVFEILKRFPVWHYSHYVTAVLKFVSRHASSLTHIELEFIPLSCIAWLGDSDMPGEDISSEDDEEEYNLETGRVSNHPGSRKRNRNDKCVSPQEINLPQLCKIRLQKMCITTMGYSKDIHIWKSLLESQAYPKSRKSNQDMYSSSSHNVGLRELRFDWLCRDPMTETRARVSGFPWIHFQAPIQACTATLVHVELANLSMVTKTFPSSPVNVTASGSAPPAGRFPGGGGGGAMHKVIPFDLSIFRHCNRLKSLILRCRENHARIYPVDLGNFARQRGSGADLAAAVDPADHANGNGGRGTPAGSPPDQQQQPNNQAAAGGVVATVGEILLMVNAMDLPESLEQLEIFRFPMLTSDIEACVRKLVNVKKLFFHECGKTYSFGVGADIIRLIAKLKYLKFLEIVGFNDSTEERKRELELVFQLIGKPFEGQDTWLELSDGSTTAYDTLESVRGQ